MAFQERHPHNDKGRCLRTGPCRRRWTAAALRSRVVDEHVSVGLVAVLGTGFGHKGRLCVGGAERRSEHLLVGTGGPVDLGRGLAIPSGASICVEIDGAIAVVGFRSPTPMTPDPSVPTDPVTARLAAEANADPKSEAAGATLQILSLPT